jgi:hypothetical protein
MKHFESTTLLMNAMNFKADTYIHQKDAIETEGTSGRHQTEEAFIEKGSINESYYNRKQNKNSTLTKITR